MLNIGWTEFVFLVLIFFVFIKPKDIPVVLKKIFYVFNKFKSFISDITTEINQSIYVEEFKKKKLSEIIKNINHSKKKLLGICVGMQILFDYGLEFTSNPFDNKIDILN